jgi:hypothetical protein
VIVPLVKEKSESDKSAAIRSFWVLTLLGPPLSFKAEYAQPSVWVTLSVDAAQSAISPSTALDILVGRCRLPVSIPVLKALMVSALEASIR